MAGRHEPVHLQLDITCLRCGSAARSQSMFKQHQTARNCPGVPAQCGCCGNNFYNRNDLAAHLNQKGIMYRAPFRLPSVTSAVATPSAALGAPPASPALPYGAVAMLAAPPP